MYLTLSIIPINLSAACFVCMDLFYMWTVLDRVCAHAFRSWSRLRRKPSTSMEGWARVGPSLLRAQPNLQRNDEEGRREEEMQRMRDREAIVSCRLFTTWNTLKQHLAEEETDENNYFKTRTPTCLSFLFLISLWSAVTLLPQCFFFSASV